MSVSTHIDDAKTRIRCERDATEAKLDAIKRFTDRVKELPPEPTPRSVQGVTAAAGALSHVSHSTEDRCQIVRRTFAETIRPQITDDAEKSESLHATIEAEFSESLAVALAPTTETSFSPELKEAVVSEANIRRVEVDVLRRALRREASRLDDAGAVVTDITEWITAKNETPLTALDFDELHRRHETLTDHRDRCEALARQRQEFLRSTTNHGGEIGISHRNLIPYIYQDFPVDYPVLTTVARLDSTCEECQRAVRQHLVRRA
ncbi:hypothetical protein A4G99_11015 [Haladaptatus sp. R4]|uniref:DUF7260 family protein n=1 Tax=Haladaptatus sp. R4 TaxID=1679489 RepID=UPI0007B4AE65|nr:hypothetical protein [Haladaptatus sp. R4]KZN24845.1 hypothetical protein A4G99_11015 [Haladaptatus sp. R4]